MNKIISCAFNMDTACVDVVYENGGTLSIYTPTIEESMRTTIYSRSKLDLLIDNEPLEYTLMVLDDTLQEYLDNVDATTREQLQNYTEQLVERFPSNVAEDIAREIMMYS